ncbi:hypothetical protein [Pseudomonas amygdali]|uniref:hypothetical protein n=1 Tax=Pseudomonas amygdali TaxID=47877 RepID=UPI00128D8917|nr:hypothetical protein [Pseudomonas amygdali]
MSDKVSKLPFHIFLKNKPTKPWDDYIKENIVEIKTFDELIEGNIFLRDLRGCRQNHVVSRRASIRASANQTHASLTAKRRS